MYLFLLTIFLLMLTRKRFALFHPLILSLAIMPALLYGLSLLHLKFCYSVTLDLIFFISLFLFLLFHYVPLIKEKRFQNGKPQISSILFILLVSCINILVFGFSCLLPAYDPIAAPSFAKIIFTNQGLPDTLMPFSWGPFLYPPGFSLLLSPLYEYRNPFVVLIVFKWMNILVLSSLPFVWGFYLNRIYKFPLDFFYVILLFYIGFLVFDRTLNLALPFAGKNSMILSSFVFPAVYYELICGDRKPLSILISIFSLVGLFLIHYSTIYMMAFLLVGHFIFYFQDFQRLFVKYVFVFPGSSLFFFPQYLYLAQNKSNISGALTSHLSPTLALSRFLSIIANTQNPYFFIFIHSGFSWEYKNVAMCLIFVLTGLLALYNKYRSKYPHLSQIHKPIWIFFTGSFLGIFFASGFIPYSELNPDYIRWFAYNYHAVIFAIFSILVLQLATILKNRINPFFSRTLRISFVFLLLYGINVYGKDIYRSYQANRENEISCQEMKYWAATVNALTPDSAFYLLTESTSLLEGSHYIQRIGALEYYAVFSNALIPNGTWMIPAREYSRDREGLPADTFYTSINKKIFYIGRRESLTRYIQLSTRLSLQNIKKLKEDIISAELIFI